MSDDLISRQAAIDALGKFIDYSDDGEQEINADCVFHTIEELPSAQPEREDREEGTWMPHKLPHGGESIDHDICSKCGEQYSDAWSYNYCPNCGAKMGG